MEKLLFTTPHVMLDLGMQHFAEEYELNLNPYIVRHFSGDFGEHGKYDDIVLTDEELEQGPTHTSDDGKLNKLGVLKKERIISCYIVDTPSGPQKFWIITDRGHEVTTLLLPSEY